MKSMDQLITIFFKESIISFEINELKYTLLANNILILHLPFLKGKIIWLISLLNTKIYYFSILNI